MKRMRFVIRIPHKEQSYRIRKKTMIMWMVVLIVACCLLMITEIANAEELDASRDSFNNATSMTLQAEKQLSTHQEKHEEEINMIGYGFAALFFFGLCLMGVTLINSHKEHEEEMDHLRAKCFEYKKRAEKSEKHYRDLEYLYDDLLKRNNDNVLLYNDLKDKYDKLVRESKTTAKR